MSTQLLYSTAGGAQYVPAMTLTDSFGNPYTAGSPVSAITGTQTSVASSASDVTILASNAARKGAIIYNDSTSVLYVLLSNATSSTSAYSLQISSQGNLTLSYGEYSGIIKGIWTLSNGFARVTELT